MNTHLSLQQPGVSKTLCFIGNWHIPTKNAFRSYVYYELPQTRAMETQGEVPQCSLPCPLQEDFSLSLSLGKMSSRNANLARLQNCPNEKVTHKTAFSKEMRPESKENVEQFYSLGVFSWLAFELQRPSNTLITRRSFSYAKLKSLISHQRFTVPRG